MVDGFDVVAGRYKVAQLGQVDQSQRDGDRVVRLDREVADDRWLWTGVVQRPQMLKQSGTNQRWQSGQKTGRIESDQILLQVVARRKCVERSADDPLGMIFVEVGLGLKEQEVVETSYGAVNFAYRPFLYTEGLLDIPHVRLDWVSSHWTHFTVRGFICVFISVYFVCLFSYCIIQTYVVELSKV